MIRIYLRHLRMDSLPAGLLGMLALVFAAESFVGRHSLDAVAPEDWQYVLARRDAARLAKGCDLLILGDSQAKFGVLPHVVESRSGLRAHNLAVWGGQAPASYGVLRRAFESGARPSAIVVDFYPLLLAKPSRASLGQLAFLMDYGSALRFGWESRSPALLVELLARQTLPSYRSRTTLREWVQAAVQGRTNRYRLLMPDALAHCARNGGAMVLPSFPDRRVDGPSHQRLAYGRGWTPDRVNADYLRLFLGLAEAHRVPVYWLIPPIHPALEAATEAAGFDARYVAFIEQQQRRFPGLVVIDGRRAGYEPAVFLDADHLGREGAFALSQDLGDLLRRLRRATPPNRWVALPRYRPRPTDPGVLAARLDVFLPEPAARVSR